MITNKIKKVFEFVDFLHNNTDEFKKYNSLVDDCWKIRNEMDSLDPDNSFQEKNDYKALNTQKNEKFNVVKTNVSDVITSKALELGISYKCAQKGYYSIEFNWGNPEIHEQKELATEEDLSTFNKYKDKYVHFRTENNNYYLSLRFFLTELDDSLQDLFVFFIPTTIQEFKTFSASIKRNNEAENKDNPWNDIIQPKPEEPLKQLTHKQIALIHAYQNEPITRYNGHKIAKGHGYIAKTSGEKLYHLFTEYYSTANRKGDEGTKLKNQNKIDLIESIIKHLTIGNQKKAKAEKNILINITKANYS